VNYVGHQPLAYRLIFSHQHYRLSHGWMLREHRLDLSELNAESPDLHLVVDPPEELQVSVRQIPRPIARPVEPATCAPERVRDELLGCELRPVEVSSGQPIPADVQLPGHTDRHRLQARTEQVDLGVRDRSAYRERPCSFLYLIYQIPRRKCRALG